MRFRALQFRRNIGMAFTETASTEADDPCVK